MGMSFQTQHVLDSSMYSAPILVGYLLDGHHNEWHLPAHAGM